MQTDVTDVQLLDLKFGSFVLVQFCLQQLLGHLNLALEAILILISLIGFKCVLIGSLSVGSGRAGLPLSSKHYGVPQLQPLEQTAVGELNDTRRTTSTSRLHKDFRISLPP